MTMHNHFSEWFLAAGIEMQNDALQARWTGLEAYEAGRAEIISLVELFFGFYDGKESFIDNFRTSFKQADGAFRMKDNNPELSVLAGATLVSVMEDRETQLGDFASLAIVSCAAQNLRLAPCVPDIAERAAKHLMTRTLKRTEPGPDAETTDDEMLVSVKQLQREIAAVTEESNVLWWVFGECSRDTGTRWSDCSVAQAAIMSGKELADLTRIMPGPAASGALLDKIVKLANAKPPAQIALKEAIGELPVVWRQGLVKNFPAALLHICPVSNGIKMSVESVSGDTLGKALTSTIKIQRGGKLAPQLLAYQVFLERLIASFWSKVK